MRIGKVKDLKRFLDPLKGHISIKPPLDLEFKDGVIMSALFTLDVHSDGFTGTKIEARAIGEYKEAEKEQEDANADKSEKDIVDPSASC